VTVDPQRYQVFAVKELGFSSRGMNDVKLHEQPYGIIRLNVLFVGRLSVT
jgi:hypothetical protein